MHYFHLILKHRTNGNEYTTRKTYPWNSLPKAVEIEISDEEHGSFFCSTNYNVVGILIDNVRFNKAEVSKL
mgnify:CR=1 FL=1